MAKSDGSSGGAPRTLGRNQSGESKLGSRESREGVILEKNYRALGGAVAVEVKGNRRI